MVSPPVAPRTIAIVGAGIAGLACARRLQAAGRQVQLFDKGRAPGGRVATRRTDEAGSFDHGAAFLTARDPGFRGCVQALCDAGQLASWRPALAPMAGAPARERWVGVPGMSALPRALAEGLDVATGRRIVALAHTPAGWELSDDQGHRAGPFDAVVVALPAPQAASLLEAPAPALASLAASARYAPTWALLAAWPVALDIPFAVYETANPIVSWAARESARPGRPAGERWVLHASANWSGEQLEAAPEAVIAPLLEAFAGLTGVTLPPPGYVSAHRWRYARVTRPLGVGCLVAPDGLVACGDWCLGPRIESAWLSGVAAAQSLLGAGGA